MKQHSLLFVFIVWVCGFGIFSCLARRVIYFQVKRLHLSPLLSYLLILFPIILIEEYLTIEVPYFWGILPMIVTFSIFFLVPYIIQRYLHCPAWLMIILTGVLGWLNEFLLVGRIHQMNGLVLGIMSILCWMIYAVMAILPSTYLQYWYIEKKKIQ